MENINFNLNNLNLNKFDLNNFVDLNNFNFNNLLTLNWIDIFVIISFAVILLVSWHRGMLLTLYKLFSFIIAIVLANSLYPKIGDYLRQNEAVYTMVSNFASERIGFDEVLDSTAKAAQNQFIESLHLPDKVTNMLIENNNPEIYKIFNVNAINDYVTGLIANILINIISIAAVFLIVSIILAVISQSINIVSRLPVIKTFNKMGGLLLGAAFGTMFIWLAFIVMFFFFPKNYQEIGILIKTSVFAKHFFNNNIFMEMILQI